MDGAAEAADHQIDVIAQAKEWPGPAKVTDRVEAIRLRIANNSQKPVQIRYSNIHLRCDDGKSFSAIPPLGVHGTVPTKASIVPQPRFAYYGFNVAPFYVNAYPGMVMYDGPFFYDSTYYENMFDRYWLNEELPTPEMAQWALPEGVLQPGGFVDGYVYFQHIPSSETNVHLEATLTAPGSNIAATKSTNVTTNQSKQRKHEDREVASVSIPFNVE